MWEGLGPVGGMGLCGWGHVGGLGPCGRLAGVPVSLKVRAMYIRERTLLKMIFYDSCSTHYCFGYTG